MLFLKQSTHENDYKSFGKPKVPWKFFSLLVPVNISALEMTTFKSRLALVRKQPLVPSPGI